MKKTIALLLLITFSINAEVYKWTDADGNVHFGDKPQTDDAEKLKLPTKPADQAPDYKARKQKQEKLLDIYASEAADKKAAAAKAEEEKKQNEEKCAELQKDIDKLAAGGRFYSKNEDGEYDFKSEEYIEEKLNRYRAHYKKNCK